MSSYQTIEGESIAEIVEKKSRFIAHLSHVSTEDEALAFLQRIRTEHAQARHNVYAYVLAGGRVRYSDDGEPSQTAGMPTLEALQHAGLQDVACVVTRYFGGTLLGTGGLVRAYTDATQAAIDAARVVTISSCIDVAAAVPYALYEQVQRAAARHGAKELDACFAEDVSLRFRLLADDAEAFVAELTELTRGQCPISQEGPIEAAF